jgi:hypothetical protein
MTRRWRLSKIPPQSTTFWVASAILVVVVYSNLRDYWVVSDSQSVAEGVRKPNQYFIHTLAEDADRRLHAADDGSMIGSLSWSGEHYLFRSSDGQGDAIPCFSNSVLDAFDRQEELLKRRDWQVWGRVEQFRGASTLWIEKIAPAPQDAIQ